MGIRLLSGTDRRLVAVLLDQQAGRSVNVEIVGHGGRVSRERPGAQSGRRHHRHGDPLGRFDRSVLP
jgi:hypothetical protein